MTLRMMLAPDPQELRGYFAFELQILLLRLGGSRYEAHESRFSEVQSLHECVCLHSHQTRCLHLEMSALAESLMPSGTTALTIYNPAPIEVGMKSSHTLLKFFEFLVVNVNLNTVPKNKKSLQLSRLSALSNLAIATIFPMSSF